MIQKDQGTGRQGLWRRHLRDFAERTKQWLPLFELLIQTPHLCALDCILLHKGFYCRFTNKAQKVWL